MIARFKWLGFGILLAAAFNAALAWTLEERRETVSADLAGQAEALARAVELKAAGAVHAVDRSLDTLTSAAEMLGPSSPALSKTLKRAARPEDGIVAVLAFDKDGEWADGSTQQRSITVWDRPYFQHHRNNADDRMLVGPPFRNRTDGAWVLPVSRRLNDAAGGFAGVLVAGLRPDSLITSAKELPQGATVLVLHAGGALIARRPEIESLFGLHVDVLEDGDVPSEAIGSAPSDFRRIVAQRRLADWPLIAVAALETAPHLQAWRRDRNLTMMLAVLGSAAVLAGAAALQVQTNRRRRAMEHLAQTNALLEERVAQRTAELEAGRDRLRAFVDVAQDAMVVIDNSGRIVEYNPAAEAMFGYEREHVMNRSLNMLMPDQFAKHHNSHLKRPNMTDAAHSMARGREVTALHRTGREFPIEVTVGTRKTADGMIHVGVIRDISARKQAEAELQHMADTDGLTGLWNRAAFWRKAALILDEQDPVPSAVLMLDADHFKKVNDTYGHAAGDQVLRALASILTQQARSGDAAGRLGGEEFALILARAPGDAPARVADHLLESVRSQTVRLDDGTEIGFRVSIGIARARPGDDVDSLLNRADKALYQAKQNGRDRWVEDRA